VVLLLLQPAAQLLIPAALVLVAVEVLLLEARLELLHCGCWLVLLDTGQPAKTHRYINAFGKLTEDGHAFTAQAAAVQFVGSSTCGNSTVRWTGNTCPWPPLQTLCEHQKCHLPYCVGGFGQHSCMVVTTNERETFYTFMEFMLSPHVRTVLDFKNMLEFGCSATSTTICKDRECDRQVADDWLYAHICC